ncbi:hypothetical protein BCR44DRAFT_89345 [Catenaria anguillulae PL171]|uniref:Uncharacterized protein n=1 Tax=Catenaria anguillulae PL171 TaxID=765915 RepID=A0A1Y2HN17_9FUNG|nr:hypothetical protein BCR44DRAFT_89345 [Catenaria anguillulae PL171]
MWKSPPSSSLTHSPASSTSAAGYPPRRPSRDPSPLGAGAGAGYDRGRYGYGGGSNVGYSSSPPTTAYNTYETARRGGGERDPRADRHGFDDLDDQPPAPTQDRRQYYSHARSPSPPPAQPTSSIPRSPRPLYDDRGLDTSGSGGTGAGGNNSGWQPRPRRPSARPAVAADVDDEPGYDRYRYQQQQQQQQQPLQRNGSFSTVAMSPRSAPAAGLSPSQVRPGQVYPRDAEADASPRYPPATLGRQPSFSRQQQEPISPLFKPTVPDASGTVKGATNKEDTKKKKKRSCLDWTRWLLAGSIARFIMIVCLIVLGLHSFMCGGGAMFLLVIIPIAGWSADGSLSIFGFRVSPPPAPPADSKALDAPYALTILGVFLLVGVLVDLLSIFAAFKLAHRKLPGLVTLGLAEVTQIVRVVFLVLMINQAKQVEGWDQQSETLARVFVVVEIIQLVTSAALYFTARWRWTEKQKFEGTAAAKPTATTTMMSSSSSTLGSAAHRPSDIEMQKPATTSTADRQSGKANPKMRFHW